jgi:hypothetical protein
MWEKLYRSRYLAMLLSEHRHNLKEGLLKKSKLVSHAYEEAGN